MLHAFFPEATVHGMRSTFRDWAEIYTNVRPQVAEAAPAHINPDKTVSAYLRTQYYAEREDLMDMWGEYLGGFEGTFEDLLKHVRREREKEI